MDFFQSADVQGVDTYINTNIYGGMATQGEGIDLRLETNYILYGNANRKPKGHWVILRQYDRCQPSAYYNKRTKEGVDGPAYAYTDVLLRSRRVPIAFKGMPLDPLKAGQAQEDRFIYYFEYTVKPKRGDHIIELSIEDHSTIPTVSQSIMAERYRIVASHPYRLENGNVQYYSAQAEIDETSY
jgi:hypothetical protein